MATALTTIFGKEIRVTAMTRQSHRQYTGFCGANGLTSMHLGLRGRQIFVVGQLREEGNNYSNARQAIQAEIDTIDAYKGPGADAIDISYQGETYKSCVLDIFEPVRDGQGKSIHWDGKYAVADFIAVWISQSDI